MATKQLKAKIRICASCAWVFRDDGKTGCPVCGFGSYGARWVLGNNYHRELIKQTSYREVKMSAFSVKLESEIEKRIKKERELRNENKIRLCI